MKAAKGILTEAQIQSFGKDPIVSMPHNENCLLPVGEDPIWGSYGKGGLEGF